ncbi:MAG: hypothetical protein FWF10_07570 [Clostridiales bacterium]|nr:hypothetical protein [Clostridiales bacterium]
MEQLLPWIAAMLLLQLIILFFIMQTVRQIKRRGIAAEAPPQPVAPALSAPSIANRGELAAVIAVAIAETMGTDVQALRIHSIRKI